MKFGKRIQSQQVPGWAPYYLDYKFLKKIINSFAEDRPASEAATLALGIRPADILSETTITSQLLESGSQGSRSEDDPDRPPLFSSSGHDEVRGPDFQAHKAAFFFKLERELEKINAFYLRKEAELTLRLETLLSKRRAAAMRGLPDAEEPTRDHVEWSAVKEGFRVLERDLGKLQQYIELNATGFRKIQKKWSKRSALKTKELHLVRQFEIQPEFNRQLVSELVDTVATCLHDLTDLSSGLKFEGRAANDVFTQLIMNERAAYVGPFRDLENNLRDAVARSDIPAIHELLHYADVLAQQNDGKSNVTRILWKVINEAHESLADLILRSFATPFDFDFIDDINGRTCVHEAAIARNARLVEICIQQTVPVDKLDIYGRSALHYASMNGNAEICQRLLDVNLSPHTLDLDNYTPIIYATMRGSVDCVKALIDRGGISPQLSPPMDNLIPLSLASQSGHAEVVTLLLQRGARCQPNTNGEYPMHLAAREGHAAVCRVLLGQEGWDLQDKYHEWTPLFHAARYGRAQCIEVLLQAGCHVDVVDEFGRCAVHYAAWYGHHECANLLLKAAETRDATTKAIQQQQIPSPAFEVPNVREPDVDFIPSLILPPPIMPHRAYGHNYLDKVNLVQVAIGTSGSRVDGSSHRHQARVRLHPPPFSSIDEFLLTSNTLKLVMTTSPDVNSAPYGISLPQGEDEGIFSFQIASLESLSLQFSIYPNFGTKTMGRAMALPSLFASIENSAPFVLPILDHRLHVIGEVYFEVNIIKPFEGVTLEVGGAVETYWKSTAIPSPGLPPQMSDSQLRQRPPSSVHTSPSNQSIMGPEGHAMTVSSLTGTYIYAVVQVTRDFHPVIYGAWHLADVGFDVGVADLTLSQFEALALRTQRCPKLANLVPQDWSRTASACMLSLTQLLKSLPAALGVCLELSFPSCSVMEKYHLGRRLDMNMFVDSVLRTISHTTAALGRSSARRRIVFTSFSPDVCAALNWKQPNYPVMFGTHCGKSNTDTPSCTALGFNDGKDRRSSSLSAGVEFCKNNNLLGVFVTADLLTPVPSLIQGIRDAGLIVGAFGSSKGPQPLASSVTKDDASVDALLQDGLVVWSDRAESEKTEIHSR